MTIPRDSAGNRRVVALCGGIGGAKLALGLAAVVPPEDLTVVVNTGDDFCHFGLMICPDLDTVTYTLAGRANPQTGWGRAGESWRFMEAVAELGGEDWFSLGDTDLATHAVRTAALTAGTRLTDVTRSIAQALWVRPSILPATDDRVETMIATEDGELPFQHYFVQRRCQPRVSGLRYAGAKEATPTPEVVAALRAPDLAAVVICPSNPYLSIDPMLAIPGFRPLLEGAAAPVLAVSPIVRGAAIKGPLAKMMTELGHAVDPAAIARHYGNLVDLLVVDEADRDVRIDGPRIHVAHTVMNTLEDRTALARDVLRAAAHAVEAR